jgi:hypothetical protein
MYDRELETNPAAMAEHNKTQREIAAARFKKNLEWNKQHPKPKKGE